ncbi:MAG TPA: ABC transporter substrate-binding protein, partial [Candidatus Aminicenantes bacterium]|nr:ABC transporter substrate-binding protein [Candidatus Aminicenantes bacterium]
MKFRKIIRIGISGILLSLFLSASSSSRDVYQPPDSQGDTFRIRNFDTTFLSRFDPAKGESVFVSQQIFDGLVRLDNDLNIVPDLAEYWDISEGGRCYTFYLRKGVRFHDGRELTAGDVEFSLRRLMDPETESPFGRLFVDKVVGGEEFAAGAAEDVAGFRILDRYIFELHWKKPYVSALGLLSMSFCRILPRETVEEDGSRFFARPVGTGPFKFDGWIRSPRLDIVGVRLARNPS